MPRNYETRDIPPAWVVIALLGLAVFGAALGAGLKTGFGALKREYHGEVFAPTRFSPPAPLLEVDEPADLRAYLACERRLLGSYGRNPRGRHIPIERAMGILAHE